MTRRIGGRSGPLILAGAAAGGLNGLFGGGGGAVLVPLLGRRLEGRQAFATNMAVLLPAAALSSAVRLAHRPADWALALPILLGGAAGGALGGLTFQRVPLGWLRTLFALFLLYGGVKYLL